MLPMQPPGTLSGPDHHVPPAGLAGDRMVAGEVLVASERVAHQDRVAALAVEAAIGLIGHGEGPQLDTAVEPERPVAAELDARARQGLDSGRPSLCKVLFIHQAFGRGPSSASG
jgi:hypothetical protein